MISFALAFCLKLYYMYTDQRETLAEWWLVVCFTLSLSNSVIDLSYSSAIWLHLCLSSVTIFCELLSSDLLACNYKINSSKL